MTNAQQLNKAMPESASPTWSVIVIARNEEDSIGRCLASVKAAFEGQSYELLVVDSASTDRTVEIANEYSDKIICLPETGQLRPSIGRHYGLASASGKWILFLDGDSAMCSGWLQHARDALESDQKLAAVGGGRVQVYEEADKEAHHVLFPYSQQPLVATDSLGGSAAYTYASLKEVGGFNPFLKGQEEDELAARLRKAGYSIKRLEIPMTEHYMKAKAESVDELLRRMSRGFPEGLGQFARHAYTYKLPTNPPFKIIGRYVQFFGLLVLGLLAAVLSITTGTGLYFSGWLLLMVGVYLLFALRARSFKKPAYYFLEWTLTSPMVLKGFLKRPRASHEFPDLLETVDQDS